MCGLKGYTLYIDINRYNRLVVVHPRIIVVTNESRRKNGVIHFNLYYCIILAETIWNKLHQYQKDCRI